MKTFNSKEELLNYLKNRFIVEDKCVEFKKDMVVTRGDWLLHKIEVKYPPFICDDFYPVRIKKPTICLRSVCPQPFNEKDYEKHEHYWQTFDFVYDINKKIENIDKQIEILMRVFGLKLNISYTIN